MYFVHQRISLCVHNLYILLWWIKAYPWAHIRSKQCWLIYFAVPMCALQFVCERRVLWAMAPVVTRTLPPHHTNSSCSAGDGSASSAFSWCVHIRFASFLLFVYFLSRSNMRPAFVLWASRSRLFINAAHSRAFIMLKAQMQFALMFGPSRFASAGRVEILK